MKPGIRARLMILALAFLVIPALGYYSSLEIRGFLLRGQQSSQLMAAQAIASVLMERYDLFLAHAGAASSKEWDAVNYIYSATAPIKLDGDSADWGSVIETGKRVLGRESLIKETGGGFDPESGGFDLAMARWGERVYLWINARDQAVVSQAPGRAAPEKADHILLTLIDGDKGQTEYLIPVSPTGELSFWARPGPGEPYLRDETLLGRSAIGPAGYRMEIAIPESRIAGSMMIKILLVDVDDPRTGRERYTLGPRDDETPGLIRLGYLESNSIQRMLENLELGGAWVMVVDSKSRVRAESGSLPVEPVFHHVISRRIMAEGSPISEIQEDGAGGDLVVSGAPIKGLERDMLGAVILASSASVAQSMQEKAMENAIEASMFTFIVITFGLALFATRLALRIHRLRREAEGAIDATGRVTVESLEASRDAGDEIGDLSRSISQLLTRLRRHQNFLALLPGALKHEINNPLNNITVSLENLEAHTPAGDAHKYIKSAGRGAARLKELVDSLAEAASVEDSIHKEKFERVCLSSLLERYMENSARMDARHIIKFANLAGDAYIEGSDFRIEQMLDKLMDNAMDYCPDGGMIEARLERSRNGLLLNFSNSGPPIPDHMKEKIFDSLVSTREGRGGARPHLGIGLYIARVIAEGHGGSISASKLPENKGTIFQMIFPENRLR